MTEGLEWITETWKNTIFIVIIIIDTIVIIVIIIIGVSLIVLLLLYFLLWLRTLSGLQMIVFLMNIMA